MRGGFLFSVVKIKTLEKGIINYLKFRIIKPEPFIKRIDVPEGRPFYYLEIYKEQCSGNYTEIYNLLGKSSQNIISCDNVNIFSGSRLKRFSSDEYKNILLLNSAKELIRSNHASKFASLLFFDLKGEYSRFIEKIADSVKNISVATNNFYRYENLKNKLFESYGISLIVTDGITDFSAYDYIISVENSKNRLLNNCLTLVNREERLFSIYKGSHISLEKQYSDLKPQGTDTLQFAAALCMESGVKALKNKKYNNFGLYEEIRF